MTPLERKIRAEITEQGPIGLDRYMQICLADPDHGYYAAGAPIGADGDFTTAPEISQIFGEMIGLWMAQCWLDQGAPDPFALVELGPGRGVLMADLLRAARVVPAFLQAARVRLVETSQPLRAQQAERLANPPGLGAPVEWRDRIGEVEPMPLFLVANEFFDALPIQQWRRSAGEWIEQRVGVRDQKLAPLDAPDAGAPPPPDAPAQAPEGALLEHSPASIAIAAQVSERIAENGGAALFIDYGYTDAARAAAGWLSTFQAVRRHRFADPFDAPGTADLTAHVAFDDLARAASRAQVYGPVGQGVFLTRLGAQARAAMLSKAAPDKAAMLDRALRRLIEPDEMGALFKAQALLPHALAPPAGFS
ncbi:MAG: SAM-dependent methyltransferase [Neomegalonema sp.]|nr:SAM-dependent methyltransferase [Neomegalonema sp.]